MTYTYLCECGTEFEVQQRISDKPEANCLNCGKLSTKRLITGGNFMLKGSCWARDNYSTELRHQIKNLPTTKEED